MMQSDRSYSMCFHTRGADFRAVFVSAAEAINAATAQVHVDEKAFYHFSELVVCANLLAGLFRDVQDITLDLTTPKYLRNLVVEATPEGIFRATCQTSEALAAVLDPAQIDQDVGGGLLHVSKRYARNPEPTRGTVGSRSNSIPNLVQQYLRESEQIATLMLTGMKLRQGLNGNIEADKCFGLLIEALPDVSEAKKFILTDNLERLESLTQYFQDQPAESTERKDVMDLLDDIYPGEQWIETSAVGLAYRCRCHRQGYLDRLAQIAYRDIREVFGEQREIEVRCGYCRNVFNYSRAEVEERIKNL